MCGGEEKCAQILVGKKLDVKRSLGRPSCRQQDGRVWTGIMCVGQGQAAGSCKHFCAP